MLSKWGVGLVYCVCWDKKRQSEDDSRLKFMIVVVGLLQKDLALCQGSGLSINPNLKDFCTVI